MRVVAGHVDELADLLLDVEDRLRIKVAALKLLLDALEHGDGGAVERDGVVLAMWMRAP